MVQLQGFGALLFGAVALAFAGVVAVMFGGPLEITLVALSLAAAYGSQWCSFSAALMADRGVNLKTEGVEGGRLFMYVSVAWAAQLASIALAALSLLMSVWF